MPTPELFVTPGFFVTIESLPISWGIMREFRRDGQGFFSHFSDLEVWETPNKLWCCVNRATSVQKISEKPNFFLDKWIAREYLGEKVGS